jgi:hypothetical protein
MNTPRQQRLRLSRLVRAAPHLQLVIVEREGDVLAAHPADRRDIEAVAAVGKGYDIWVRPRGPIVADHFKIGAGVVLDRGLEPARFGLTLREAIEALGGPVHPVRDEIWELAKEWVTGHDR